MDPAAQAEPAGAHHDEAPAEAVETEERGRSMKKTPASDRHQAPYRKKKSRSPRAPAEAVEPGAEERKGGAQTSAPEEDQTTAPTTQVKRIKKER